MLDESFNYGLRVWSSIISAYLFQEPNCKVVDRGSTEVPVYIAIYLLPWLWSAHFLTISQFLFLFWTFEELIKGTGEVSDLVLWTSNCRFCMCRDVVLRFDFCGTDLKCGLSVDLHRASAFIRSLTVVESTSGLR